MSGSKRQSAASARAEVEALRRVNRESQQAALDAYFADGIGGSAVLTVAWVTTLLFAVAQLVGVLDYAEGELTTGLIISTIVSLGLFVAGCVAFAGAIMRGAARSRESVMGIGGWFLLAGSAPGRVRLVLLGSLAAQFTIGIVAAFARPFSPLAFGTLSWIWGLALCGWWSARHGYFPRRAD